MRVLAAAALLLAGSVATGCSDGIEDPNPAATGADIVARGTDPLTAAEIRIYLRDSTLTHTGETRDWHVYLAPEGALFGLGVNREDRSEVRATGRWTVVEDGLLCREWDNDWGGGIAGCARVYRYGEDYVFVARSAAEGEEPREIRRTRRAGNTRNF